MIQLKNSLIMQWLKKAINFDEDLA